MKNYTVFKFLDEDFFGTFIFEEDALITRYDSHPKTNKRMSADEARALGEDICNPKLPKTKLDFFSAMSYENFQKYFEGKQDVDFVFESFQDIDLGEQVKNFKTLLYKMEVLQDFYFTEQDLKILEEFCKVYKVNWYYLG